MRYIPTIYMHIYIQRPLMQLQIISMKKKNLIIMSLLKPTFKCDFIREVEIKKNLFNQD